MYFLCIKTHNKTNLKYLCQTKKKNPYKYLGSGVRWLNHLRVHGTDISTKIISKFKNKKDLVQAGTKFSKRFNIVKSRKWANLRIEEGDGGDTSKFIDYKAMKPMPTGLWKRPDLIKYNLTRMNPNKGKKLSYKTRKRMSKSQMGRVITEEAKKKMSKAKKGVKFTLEQKLAGTKIFKIIKGEKKSLMQISEDTGLSYMLLIQRYQKNHRISYKELTAPSLFEKIEFNGQKYMPRDFAKKIGISLTTYYRWKNNGLTTLEMSVQKSNK